MDISLIKELRARTHVSLGKCKKALEQTNGDIETAIVELQKAGLLKVAERSKKEAKEGQIFTYVHGCKIGVMVEVNCETDFSARNELFTNFCEAVALQIAAMNPPYLSTSDVPDDIEKQQREIFLAQVPPKAPENKIEHIVNNKMKKWYGEVCLLDQKSVVDSNNKTIEQLRADLVMQIGENVVVRRFMRWELGQ